MQSAQIEITIGRDDMSADRGHLQSEETSAKSKLIIYITAIIEDRGLSQEDVAKLLRISSPNEASSMLDGLRKGQLDKVTIGQLVDYRAALNVHVEVNVHHQPDVL
jgi:predicted XRE-type DNA-binding protein